ncbi:MAG: group III truncated hemoglobin [Bacteroidia bacterium]|nr:group III truncated hemoglobin [Bacteroidia bacterium]MBP9689577.1 group III truncated hemoglobin [Bacteroidia bacterium]
MSKDIITIDDIKIMVDSFYTKIRKDELLGPIFNEKIGDNWATHLEKMYRFWQTVLLEEHTYNGSPFSPHASMPLFRNHFDRWMQLFNENIDETFTGEKAQEAKWRGEKMAEMFHYKIAYYRNNDAIPNTN